MRVELFPALRGAVERLERVLIEGGLLEPEE